MNPPQWVRPPENNVRLDLRPPDGGVPLDMRGVPLDLRPKLRERVVRLLVEALEDDDPMITVKIGANRIEVSW